MTPPIRDDSNGHCGTDFSDCSSHAFRAALPRTTMFCARYEHVIDRKPNRHDQVDTADRVQGMPGPTSASVPSVECCVWWHSIPAVNTESAVRIVRIPLTTQRYGIRQQHRVERYQRAPASLRRLSCMVGFAMRYASTTFRHASCVNTSGDTNMRVLKTGQLGN
jgi:hypothetical protein